MVSIISLIFILAVSILITRVATVALMETGLSKDAARFQARSAFTGVGFTTNESEKIVNHPVRRRIVQLLMLLGNAGVATAMTTLILSFVSPGDAESVAIRVLMILAGIVALIFFSQSKFIDYWLSRLIRWALDRYTRLDTRDYASLLHVHSGYRIGELRLKPNDWLTGKKLQDTRLREEGVNVLGVQRKTGKYLGALKGDIEIRAGDTLILYGREKSLEELDVRQKGIHGDIQHNEAVEAERKEKELQKN
ncbi:MAG: potassium transporter TrkA [Chitinivibrionales bacterium]|nr:potassium transporter TrkA [Chitinivibrionales bacterium]